MTPPATLNRCRSVQTLLAACGFLLSLFSPSAALHAQEYFDQLDPSETYPTSLEIPVDGVTVEQLVNTWGAPRSGGRHHEGIDIFAPRNTPIRAVTDGIIYVKGYRSVGGRIVMILDPLGYLHLYAHLETYGTQLLRERIYRGDIIGYVGNSGNAASSSCHLHYGIADPERNWINPYWVLARPEFDPDTLETLSGVAAPLASEGADHSENSGSH